LSKQQPERFPAGGCSRCPLGGVFSGQVAVLVDAYV